MTSSSTAMTATQTFAKHVEAVHGLMNFDRQVMDFSIRVVEQIEGRLNKEGRSALQLENALTALRGVRTNDSLRPQYQAIFNQALVLLVSYFSSTLHELFTRGLASSLESGARTSVLDEELKVTIGQLKELAGDFGRVVPELLVQSRDISFQDMKSIARAFETYLGVAVTRDQTVNDIVVAQACRHAIVHAGAVADDRLIHQIRGATPRSVKTDLKTGQLIQFAPQEVDAVSSSMAAYIDALSAAVAGKSEQSM